VLASDVAGVERGDAVDLAPVQFVHLGKTLDFGRFSGAGLNADGRQDDGRRKRPVG
jgi:hypothetical protein